MDAVLSVIDLLDAPEPQVMIEARIVETTKRFSRDLGVNWGVNAIADAAHGNTTGLVFPAQRHRQRQRQPARQRPTTARSDLKLGNVLNTFNLDVALQAAESEGLITILSAPKVATLNNQRATDPERPPDPGADRSSTTRSTVQFINATLRLDVDAAGHRRGDGPDGHRHLEARAAARLPGARRHQRPDLAPRTPAPAWSSATAARRSSAASTRSPGRTARTACRACPTFRSSGHLFKNKTRDEENDELLIFITPRVIKI